MPKSDDQSEEALDRLEARLDAFEAKRAPSASPLAGAGNMSQGYRMLWEVVSGFLGGAALGWLVDKVAGTAPLGLVGGLVIGSGVGVFLAARSAWRISSQAHAANPALPVVDDDDED